MLDLHSHLLPGIDDGASDVATAMAMAEAFVAEGVEVVACTPHILPGLYHNEGPQIRQAVDLLQSSITEAGLPLLLTTGADVHLAPGLVAGLRSGTILSLADSRYLLIEPPHHVLPARLEDTLFELLVAGYVPIITHPERLSWIKGNYEVMGRLVQHGVWMQITAGSLTGEFGRGARYWAERMLDEGLVHILASDAHDVSRRRPNLSAGAEAAAKRVGNDEAFELVAGRPRAIIDDRDPLSISVPRSGEADIATQPDQALAKSRWGTNNGKEVGKFGLPSAVRNLGRRLRRLAE
ncbi:MAG: tyrosine-protein phosphatase [Hyphomicrobiaceae bacterium]